MTAPFPDGAAARPRRSCDEPVTRRAVRTTEPLLDVPAWPRLAAIAPSMAEMVHSMGGWLFDQALAGWDVAVLTSDGTHARAAAILGAHAYDLESALANLLPRAGLQVAVLPADLYDRDPRIRRAVLDALRERSADIMFWGNSPPAEFEGVAQPVRYQLTIAARAFKAQALAASGLPAARAEQDPLDDLGRFTETFSTVWLRFPRQVSS
jgi:hypothetical protein